MVPLWDVRLNNWKRVEEYGIHPHDIFESLGVIDNPLMLETAPQFVGARGGLGKSSRGMNGALRWNSRLANHMDASGNVLWPNLARVMVEQDDRMCSKEYPMTLLIMTAMALLNNVSRDSKNPDKQRQVFLVLCASVPKETLAHRTARTGWMDRP